MGLLGAPRSSSELSGRSLGLPTATWRSPEPPGYIPGASSLGVVATSLERLQAPGSYPELARAPRII
eukprot:3423644-Alexandrium_andersonii.AAC.1